MNSDYQQTHDELESEIAERKAPINKADKRIF